MKIFYLYGYFYTIQHRRFIYVYYYAIYLFLVCISVIILILRLYDLTLYIKYTFYRRSSGISQRVYACGKIILEAFNCDCLRRENSSVSVFLKRFYDYDTLVEKVNVSAIYFSLKFTISFSMQERRLFYLNKYNNQQMTLQIELQRWTLLLIVIEFMRY